MCQAIPPNIDLGLRGGSSSITDKSKGARGLKKFRCVNGFADSVFFL